MNETMDYEKIMSDRKLFNKTVYTPLSEALKILEERRQDKVLVAKIKELLKNDIPDFLLDKKCAVLGRHVATPNHENRMFISLAKQYGLFPVFFEYHDDKFITNNSYKHSLGQLHVRDGHGHNKTGDYLYERINIVDFDKHNGKKIKEVTTLWNEPLVDFHRRLFLSQDYNIEEFHLFDGSEWFKRNGDQKAVNFYTNFLMLFVCFGILFENFLISDSSDGDFTKNVVLPAIEKVEKLTGVRPLIIPIGPLDIEEDEIWFHHLPKIKNMIPSYE